MLRNNRSLTSWSPRGCVVVPTMGALHAGHAALIAMGVHEARARGTRCVVTVFVNPTQFNDPSDLAAYPRTLDADAAWCARTGADAVFAPSPEDVYPPGQPIPTPALPTVATEPGLEDAFRPGHFAGVCQVVLRLFRLCEPSAAVFGEKDWQQLQVVHAMAAAEMPGVEILPCPTVREADGLAMSSRNARLSEPDRAQARSLSAALRAAGQVASVRAAESAMARVLSDAGVRAEYAVVRDAATLEPLGDGRAPGRALIAAWAGGVRLIDNAPWAGA